MDDLSFDCEVGN